MVSSVFEYFPLVNGDIFGLELRTMAYMIAALGVVQIFFYSFTSLLNPRCTLGMIWVLSLVNMVINFELIYGIIEESEILIEVWLYFTMAYLILMFITIYWFFIRMVGYNDTALIGLSILMFLWLCLSVYFFFVVNSYLMEIRHKYDPDTEGTTTTTPTTTCYSTTTSTVITKKKKTTKKRTRSTTTTAAKGMCFPAGAMVHTESGPKDISTLQKGDRVMAADDTGKLVYSEVVAFMDREPNVTGAFVQVTAENGVTITMTPLHLLLLAAADGWREAFAASVTVGDVLLTRGPGSVMRPSRVVHTRTVSRLGGYAPLTKTGTIIVDDALASCYAVLRSHSVAHAVMAPLRWMSSFSSREEQRGVHWYAKALESVEKFVLPTFNTCHRYLFQEM